MPRGGVGIFISCYVYTQTKRRVEVTPDVELFQYTNERGSAITTLLLFCVYSLKIRLMEISLLTGINFIRNHFYQQEICT